MYICMFDVRIGRIELIQLKPSGSRQRGSSTRYHDHLSPESLYGSIRVDLFPPGTKPSVVAARTPDPIVGCWLLAAGNIYIPVARRAIFVNRNSYSRTLCPLTSAPIGSHRRTSRFYPARFSQSYQQGSIPLGSCTVVPAGSIPLGSHSFTSRF
jgi:hypothetical protein